jgi:hypothetical protein
MGKQILESNNYSKFTMTDFNRDAGKTKELEASFREHGWIDACPLHVVRDGEGKLRIKQGHHRFIAAQKIGIPVKYVECNDKATIHQLEKTSKRWNMEDFLASHCRVGEQEYIKVRDYCDESGITLQAAISMLGGHSAGSGNFTEEFKCGGYKIKEDSVHAYVVQNIVLHMKKHKVAFYNNNLLVQAISKVVWLPEFDVLQFKSKIKAFHSFMEKQASLDKYLDMVEDIYNRQSRSKVPVKFLATEAAKQRSATKLPRG